MPTLRRGRGPERHAVLRGVGEAAEAEHGLPAARRARVVQRAQSRHRPVGRQGGVPPVQPLHAGLSQGDGRGSLLSGRERGGRRVGPAPHPRGDARLHPRDDHGRELAGAGGVDTVVGLYTTTSTTVSNATTTVSNATTTVSNATTTVYTLTHSLEAPGLNPWTLI